MDDKEEEDLDEDEEEEDRDVELDEEAELLEWRLLNFLMVRLILRKADASCGCALNGSPDGGGGIVTSTSSGGM